MSQKTDNMIKLALVFFVSLLSFSIGTYVGKKYSDNQHKLALLEPKKSSETATDTHGEFESEKETAAAPSEHTGHGESPAPEDLVGQIPSERGGALTDSEVAKLAEEFASEEEEATATDGKPVENIVADTKPVPEIEAPVAKAKAVPVIAKSQSTTALPAKVQAKSAGTPALAETRKDDSTEGSAIKPTPRDTATAEDREPASIQPRQEFVPVHYTVQIGSYPTELEAMDMTKTLQSKGYKTSYVPAKVNGQTWYRVNVGLFGTIKEAQDYKREFLQETSMSSAIVQRVQH